MDRLDATPTWWRPEAGRRTSRDGGVAFAALVAFTGILFLSPQVWFPVLQNFRIALLAAGLAIVAHLLERTLHRQPIGPLHPEFVIALALVGWAALTAPLSYWPGGSVAELIDPFLKAVAFFWLIGTLVATQGRLRLFMWVLVLCSIPLSVSALQHYRAGDFLITPAASVQRITGFNDGGSGLAGNPNDLALILNLMIPLAAALCAAERALAARAVAALALLLAVAGVVVTFSRAGFVALATIGLLSLVAMVRRAPAGALAVVLGLVVITPSVLPPGYVQRLTTITDISSDPTGSAQGRWTDLTVAADLAARNPVIGVGLGQNLLALNRERGPTWREVHNVYLQYRGRSRRARSAAVPLAVRCGLPCRPSCEASVDTGTGAERGRGRRPGGADRLVCVCRRRAVLSVAYHFYFFLIAGLALAVTNVCRATIASRSRSEAPA